jgi:DNA-binding LytR/AlgR family response regulator
LELNRRAQLEWERGKTKIFIVGVCDDDAADRTQIITAVEAYFRNKDVEGKVFSYASAEELNFELESKKLQFDLVFLDIIMNDMDGMTCARLIRQSDKLVKIVFLTSSTNHVYEGYEVQATAYLVKPVDAKKLAVVLDNTIGEIEAVVKESIAVTTGGVTQRILLRDIRYLESKKNKVMIVLAHGECLAVYTTLDELAQSHQSTMWIRSHKSYVVNFLYIEQYLSDKFVLRDGTVIPISRNHKEKVRECFFNLLHNQ